MERTFEVDTEVLSLQKISGIKVATRILTASKRKHVEYWNIWTERVYLYRALIFATDLHLPSILQEIVKSAIRSVYKELAGWYDQFAPHSIGTWPVVTQRGQVDHVSSAKLLLKDQRLSVFIRYAIACGYCFEQQICELGKQLSQDEQEQLLPNHWNDLLFSHSDSLIPLARYWFSVYELGSPLHINCVYQIGCRKKNCPMLRQVDYDLGLKIALTKNGIQAGIVHLLDRASIDATIMCVIKVFRFTGRKLHHSFTPALLHRLVMVLPGPILIHAMYEYVWLMLYLLIKPQYLHYFSEFAHNFFSYLKPSIYWKLMKYLSREALQSDRDLDYRGAIIEFWKLGEEEGRNFVEYTFNSFSKFNHILYNIVRTKDPPLIRFVLCKIPKDIAKLLLLNLSLESTLLFLLCQKEYRLLEQFIECCAKHDSSVMLELIQHACERDVLCMHFKANGISFLEEWYSLRRQLFKIVYKVNASLSTSQAGS